MITPLMSKVSESCMYVSGSAGCKLGRSPFSCVLPASASGKSKVKPVLEMVGPDIRQGREGQKVTEKYRRHIPVEKVVEMVQTDQELQEEPLDNSIVLDTQPAVWREATIFSSPSCHNRKRISVSGSFFPCQQPSHQSKSEPPPQLLPAPRSSGGLSHKELHAQLTQRLEQVLRERVQQEQNPPEIKAAEKETGLVKKPRGPTPTEQSGWAKGSEADGSNNTKKERAAQSMVKQIKNHYNQTGFNTAAQDQVSWFNTVQTNRYSFNKSWCPSSVARISAHTHGLLKTSSAYQSKRASDQNKDIYAFGLDAPELSKKKSRKSSEMSGINSSSSLTLSSTSKKCPPVKLAGRHVKKHLFSDTDTDMTETSWLNSANRRPKPKLADYTRKPVKSTHPPANITFETPKMDIPSPKSAKALPKMKRKRQKKVVEENHKTGKDVASSKPTGRPRRATVLTKSYRELSDSQSESETNEPPPAKKFIAKQPEKSQRITSVQNKAASVEPPIKKKCKPESKKVYKALKGEQEKEFSNHEKSTHTEMITTVLGSTKGHEIVLPPKLPSSHAPSLPSNIAAMTSTAKLRSTLGPVVPLCKQPQTPQVLQPSSVQGIAQERNKDIHSDQTDKENKQPGKYSSHSVMCSKLMEKKKVSEVLGFEQSLNRKKVLSSTSTKESWASKHTSLYRSPFSIEKMRSAETNESVLRSPSTPPQFLCISPVGAPPLELPSHLRGIQASSFYRTPGGLDSAACLPHSFVTPVLQRQTAQESARQPFVPPLIASTGGEKSSSLLNSPALEEELKCFLNNTSQGALQASFDKESVFSLMTLSQSSHTSVKNMSIICTELEKTPASVQRDSVGKAESGPTTTRTWHSSCSCTSLSEGDDSEDEDKTTKTGPSELAVRMKPRKLFKPNNNQPSIKKDSKQPMQVGSIEEEKENESDMRMRSTVVSSCWEASVKEDMDFVHSEVSTSQEMDYVCRQFSSELKRKFENRSRRMDLFTKQSLKTCKQHVSTITMKVQQYRSQRLETVKHVLMEEIKNMEQDETSLKNMEAELTAYWKKQALAFHSYQERETQRLNNLKTTIETNTCRNLDYEEQIFFSQMHLMKKDMKSVQDHLCRQMHENELQSVRRGLHTLFLSDVPVLLP